MRTELIDYDPDPQREDEIAREELWDAFVSLLRTALRTEGLAGLLHVLATAYDCVGDTSADWIVTPGSFAASAQDFASTEGWAGVLAALARALREQDAECHALMDRR
jgi:hypothetical protein